jgi:glycosyltransferase involved in cell wall biosynthesis
MKIIIICPYPPGTAPSQRFRFEQYEAFLRKSNIKVEVQPFISIKAWIKFSQKGFGLYKTWLILNGFFKRISLLFNISDTDTVFIHREATPLGPPLVEYIITKLLKKKIIYDFDDAIWLTDNTRESPIARVLRCRWKISFICRWSYKISCGNPYLAEYASQFNPNVVVNPTTLDVVNIHKPVSTNNGTAENVTIGWTGSRSTLKYLNTILPALQVFERKYRHILYLIIADKNPELPLANVVFLPWKKETEVTDLARIDIGIMPLPDDAWTRGKCGFKALQYMAMGIPAVVSPVAVNREIVQHGIEGFWCTTQEEWFARLEELVLDPVKRTEMGKRGRDKVVARYSVASNADNFLSLFE